MQLTVSDSTKSTFELKSYKFEIPKEYNSEEEGEIAKIQSKSKNFKAIVKINEGTVDEIKEHIDLLSSPIEEQGATIEKKAELQEVKGKELITIEYSLDGREYLIAYSKLDDENIINILCEKDENLQVLEFFVNLINTSERV